MQPANAAAVGKQEKRGLRGKQERDERRRKFLQALEKEKMFAEKKEQIAMMPSCKEKVVASIRLRQQVITSPTAV